MPLYHCTHLDLGNNNLIKPGNWGRKLFEIGSSHRCWSREMALEAVRAYVFPHKPSRLESTFVCDSIESIRCYKSTQCPEGYIYEVEVQNITAPTHKGDFNAVEPLPNHSDDMWAIAHNYWQYSFKTNVTEWPGVECSEIVTSSSLKVIRKIS